MGRYKRLGKYGSTDRAPVAISTRYTYVSSKMAPLMIAFGGLMQGIGRTVLFYLYVTAFEVISHSFPSSS
jgi:hypothetical protein